LNPDTRIDQVVEKRPGLTLKMKCIKERERE